jgi:hypothetical protein
MNNIPQQYFIHLLMIWNIIRQHSYFIAEQFCYGTGNISEQNYSPPENIIFETEHYYSVLRIVFSIL